MNAVSPAAESPVHSHGSGEYRRADVYVGARIEARRIQLGLSQQRVATLLNVSERQLANYEQGTDLIPAAVLKAIAQALTVSLGWFFFGLMIDLVQHGEPDGDASAPVDQSNGTLLPGRKQMCDELNQLAWSLARQALARQAMTT